jgi:hypothetical protein
MPTYGFNKLSVAWLAESSLPNLGYLGSIPPLGILFIIGFGILSTELKILKTFLDLSRNLIIAKTFRQIWLSYFYISCII